MATTSTPTADSTAASAKQAQSTIGFPYGDLDDAASVAAAIMKLGGMPCEPDQLAGAMNQTPTSGNFRMKVATARTFGVLETVQGKYQLTELGFALMDKERERASRVEAFLKVPLYAKIYEQFRNKQLPPRPAALEHTFVQMGVVATQKERARQAFDRSAQQAGFFDQGGRDRLIKPVVGSTFAQAEVGVSSAQRAEEFESPNSAPSYGSGRGGPPFGLHPFVQGLLETLPEPQTNWTVEGRAKWLQAAANIFDLIYKGDGKIDVLAVPSTHKPDKAV